MLLSYSIRSITLRVAKFGRVIFIQGRSILSTAFSAEFISCHQVKHGSNVKTYRKSLEKPTGTMQKLWDMIPEPVLRVLTKVKLNI